MRSMNRSRCCHPLPVTITLAELQLKEALLATMVATFRAWKASSSSLYKYGTIAIGVTLPNSDVIGLVSTGSTITRRRSLSGPGGPQTSSSWVLIEPVRWTESIPS